MNFSEKLRSFEEGADKKKNGLNATRKMTPPKAQLRFDYQQSLLLGEVRNASPKKNYEIKLLLARHWNPRSDTDASQEFYKRGGQKCG